MAAASEVRSLYRRILRTAAVWPSIRRAAIITEIRADFRRNATAPSDKAPALIQQARDGLDTLQRQTSARTAGSFSFR
jgi:hypothetical protein